MTKDLDKLRQELYNIVGKHKTLISKEVLKVSQRLDEAIVKEMKKSVKDAKKTSIDDTDWKKEITLIEYKYNKIFGRMISGEASSYF